MSSFDNIIYCRSDYQGLTMTLHRYITRPRDKTGLRDDCTQNTENMAEGKARSRYVYTIVLDASSKAAGLLGSQKKPVCRAVYSTIMKASHSIYTLSSEIQLKNSVVATAI